MTGSIPRVAASGGLVLVLNSGSSSVKFALLNPETGDRAIGGEAQQVGTPEAVLSVRRYPADAVEERLPDASHQAVISCILDHLVGAGADGPQQAHPVARSEEHTPELQSRLHLVCRLLLEKKKTNEVHHSTIQKKINIKPSTNNR